MTDQATASILSDRIYENIDEVNYFGPANRYQVLQTTGNALDSGYYGAVVRDTQTNTNYLVSRGTEFNYGVNADFGDIAADISLGLGGLAGDQYADAMQFLQDYNQINSDNPVTHSVGHSLGGYIAQLVGISNGHDVTVFGSPGANGAIDDLQSLGVDVAGYDKNKITSVVAKNDTITEFGANINGINVVTIDIEDRLAVILR